MSQLFNPDMLSLPFFFFFCETLIFGSQIRVTCSLTKFENFFFKVRTLLFFLFCFVFVLFFPSRNSNFHSDNWAVTLIFCTIWSESILFVLVCPTCTLLHKWTSNILVLLCMTKEMEGFSVPAKEVQFLMTSSDQFKIRKTLPVGNMLASLNSVGKMSEKLLKFEDQYLDFSFDIQSRLSFQSL